MASVTKYIFVAAAIIALTSCQTAPQLSDFSSDGCSLFPERSPRTGHDWSDCCLIHDIAYWQGGTREQRHTADLELKTNVLKATGDKRLANLMLAGVRVGGSPYFPTNYRWGYGWKHRSPYAPLTENEKVEVERKLDAYFDDHPLPNSVLSENGDYRPK